MNHVHADQGRSIKSAMEDYDFACELAFKSLLKETDRACIHGSRELYDRLDPIH